MDYITMHQTATPNLQSVINQSLVFHYLKEHGSSYRAQISLDLNISLPAVGRALDELVEKKFVIPSEYKMNTQKRRVQFYESSLDDFILISIDAYNNLITADKSNSIIKFDMNADADIGESFTAIIDDFVINTLHKSTDMIKAICIAFPGIVNPDKGVVEKAIYHPQFENYPIVKVLEGKYSCTVFIDNVVKLAVLQNKAELGDKYSNIVAMDIGMEIGAGIMINGSVYRGENYIAGEIGFYADTSNGSKKLNGHSSTLRKLAYMLKEEENGDADFNEFSCRDKCIPIIDEAFRTAHNGDRKATAVIDQFAEEISLLINKIDPLLNPAAIVISGEICTIPYSEELFLKKVVEKYHKLRFSNVSICFSPSGPIAGLLGGAKMAEDIFMKQQFPYVMIETDDK